MSRELEQENVTMFDFENMSIDDLQRFANGLIVVAVATLLALGGAFVAVIRMTNRDTRRHNELVALMTEIRNRLDQPKP